MATTNAERQRAFRARKKALGLDRQFNAVVSDDEAFILDRVLRAMRETGAVPASLRDPKTGRYVHLDL